MYIFFKATCMKIFKKSLTVSRHAESQALLESAGLASVPIYTIHHTVLLPWTLIVYHARTLRSAKKAFAALTRNHAIVDPTGLVTAHLARNDLDLGWKKIEEKQHYCIASQKFL